jgi:hypothetical protein
MNGVHNMVSEARIMKVGESVAKPVMNDVHNIVFECGLIFSPHNVKFMAPPLNMS